MEQATPPQYATLEAAFEALEVDRLDLKADRATLGGCSCSEIDAVIAQIDAMAAEIEDVIDGWQA